MNWYDLIILVVIALLAWRGLRRGLVAELLGLISFLVGLYLAFRFDGALGAALARLVPALTATEARIIAFVIILVAVGVGLGLLAARLSRIVARIPIVSALDRVGGLVVSILLALIAVWIVTSAFLLLPSSVVPFSAGVHGSETARLLPEMTPRWNKQLQDYLENFTGGRLDPGLRQELQRLSSPRPAPSQ